MTQAQMVLEKITLQKCLLYFESLHGRPGTKQEKNLVKPLYDRYQMIKHLLCASPTISTIVKSPRFFFFFFVVFCYCLLKEAAFCIFNQTRCQLLECLRQTRAEKKARRKVLREFEEEFHRQTGRICQKEDRTPMKDEYQEYKQLKAKLRLLEVLLSKQEDPKTM
uniref:FAM13A-like domain-containing protein n=1 Tax=Sphaeramia orbicularis TaxID=375764 RepID=A0A673A103_9TELE